MYVCMYVCMYQRFSSSPLVRCLPTVTRLALAARLVLLLRWIRYSDSLQACETQVVSFWATLELVKDAHCHPRWVGNHHIKRPSTAAYQVQGSRNVRIASCVGNKSILVPITQTRPPATIFELILDYPYVGWYVTATCSLSVRIGGTLHTFSQGKHLHAH